MYELAICDDDGEFASELKAQLTELLSERGAEGRVTLYSEPEGLMSALLRGESCDLIFLDILFGTEKGVRFARTLRERKWDVELVFVTSTDQYALAGYDVRPLNYLLKPVSREKLSQVLDCFLETRTPQMLQLSTSQGLIRLAMMDVLYFEIYSHTIVIHQRDGGERTCRGALGELEAALPPNCFVRTHRSFLVNLAHIAEIERNRARLTSGEFVPISKAAYPNVLTSMIAYDRSRNRLN